MAQLRITIGTSTFPVACSDGDEKRVRELADEVEKKLDMVRQHLAPTSESHALFLTALLMADEKDDARAAFEKRLASHGDDVQNRFAQERTQAKRLEAQAVARLNHLERALTELAASMVLPGQEPAPGESQPGRPYEPPAGAPSTEPSAAPKLLSKPQTAAPKAAQEAAPTAGATASNAKPTAGPQPQS
ncbi:cell division protein ZapA [Formicincola oecophyllae]|uniref:Cell division protein ZapA n=1 Tax=Formicincola oecophyllae TaxID=2558361 RepID=A0A4Y6U920_9PROT|nr:cell division protein ZapA [Formicincola oecophyllae]QDH13058.1 cell division protein ZapA [Formicincola oecophyllae]